MADTTLAEVAGQIQKYWSPLFMKELRESLLLGALVNKDYQGQIQRQGDTVRVSQINALNGQLLTVGVNADSFDSEAISTSYVDIVADKRAVASYTFQDLVELQSQISQQNPEVMNALNYAIGKKINDYLYSLVVPSSSSPDHTTTGVSDFNASVLAAQRVLAAQAKWRMEPGWYCLLDPQYYGDVMNAMTLTSSDYGATDAPVISGQVALKRYGFNVFEDNSRSADYALLFHPDFMHLVMQSSVQVKISDLHALGQFGVKMSVDVVFGAKMGIDGGKKCMTVTA